jgi:LuxR family maltose regulon positive regulatory protein
LSELFCEQNDLEAATEHLLRSKELGEQAALPRWSFRWYLAQARIKFAHGDLDGALDALDVAERNYIRGPVPDVHPIAAQRARVWVAQGGLAKAQNWAREQDLSAGDDLSHLREFEHITLARILIAQYRNTGEERSILDALELLKRLLDAAEDDGRMGSLIEILVLQALAHEAQDKIDTALKNLERALELAEPEGFVRIFVDEGEPMKHLLSEAITHGGMPDYVSKLLGVLKDDHKNTTTKSSQPLIEPLSERELEILQLISEGLSNRQISERLYLAMPTVKGHNRNIFGKLQVKRRTEAVARARELELL